MKTYQKAVLAVLVVLVLAALGAVIYTRHWANYQTRLRDIRTAAKHSSDAVDTRALDTAKQLAALAVTPTEEDYSHQALELADHSIDLAFAAALEDATENPAPLTPETRQLTARIKDAENHVATDQDLVDKLTGQLAKARASAKDAIQEQLDGATAQLTLDQDELDDAHEDLIRAGGDRHATIQRLLDQHKSSSSSVDKPQPAAAAAAAPPPELTKAKSILALGEALLSLRTKQNLLRDAQQNAAARATALSSDHEALEKTLTEEKAQKTILPKKRAAAQQAANPADANAPAAPLSAVAVLKQLALDQKKLSQFDERIECEQQLAGVYGNWITYITARRQAFLHGVFLAAFWIFLIALVVFLANELIQKFFADLSTENRQLHTARAGILLGVQALGIILILLVIFGQPANFATILAFAGAGLTVALKDFIVGFIGWFILMGKDGIRPGDWVEINGVGGEVVEVGPLHTVLLETGNWLDAAHPTGRKVTFVNSFAIEGHYFNFSSAGQWLWDELQVQVPQETDPYPIAEAIRKVATEVSAENARLAEKEWERVAPGAGKRSFTADPSLSVRPLALGGVNILVRYITRASERQENRARLYRAVVEILRAKDLPAALANPAAARPAKQSA
ncbi:MAG TPA: mechanosensitive ion channel family protein [Candidatus Sulfotelmatobacter sp.]|nr:mechanosensitive ion channel family protein [Candidatus Sulfotelmatobacter sp.]